MKRPHHVIYLPGLGDERPRAQPLALSLWKIYGLEPHYYPIGWAESEPFTAKLDRLMAYIDRLFKADGLVSVAASSAGTIAALDLFARRPDTIHRLALICPKIQHLEKITDADLIPNPAFGGAVDLLPESLSALDDEQRGRIMTLRPLYDDRIEIGDMILEGAHNKRMYSALHGVSIGYALTIGSFSIARFLKSKT